MSSSSHQMKLPGHSSKRSSSSLPPVAVADADAIPATIPIPVTVTTTTTTTATANKQPTVVAAASALQLSMEDNDDDDDVANKQLQSIIQTLQDDNRSLRAVQLQIIFQNLEDDNRSLRAENEALLKAAAATTTATSTSPTSTNSTSATAVLLAPFVASVLRDHTMTELLEEGHQLRDQVQQLGDHNAAQALQITRLTAQNQNPRVQARRRAQEWAEIDRQRLEGARRI